MQPNLVKEKSKSVQGTNNEGNASLIENGGKAIERKNTIKMEPKTGVTLENYTML